MELTFELTLDYGDLTEEEMGVARPDPTATDVEEAVRTHLASLDGVRRPIAITAERR